MDALLLLLKLLVVVAAVLVLFIGCLTVGLVIWGVVWAVKEDRAERVARKARGR